MPYPLSPIERHCSVVRAAVGKQDVFVNEFDLWRPGPRGIFGGIAIAQSLRAAQATIEDHFDVHSMHCSFVFAGQRDKPIIYTVERIRDGRSFCTRYVRASQASRPIFLANISFAVRAEHPGALEHADPLPSDVPLHDRGGDAQMDNYNIRQDSPYVNKSVGIRSLPSSGPSGKSIHQWIKARGPISSNKPEIHLAALAFMSDSYFLAAVPHSHGIWGFVNPPVTEFYPTSHDIFDTSSTHTQIPRAGYDHRLKTEGQPTRKVSMMVSLDHTIYFHNQRKLRADEWLLAEVHTSWAGDGRGLIHQKIWSERGVLLATCIQEVWSLIKFSRALADISQGIVRLEDFSTCERSTKSQL
ncbi:thioesterase-like superfamily-domain-containing protein [Aspergillus floccosus]